MIYMSVPHADDTDADYFKFDDLDSAVLYIKQEQIEEFVLTQNVTLEMPEDDYTYVVMSQEPQS